MSASRTLDSTVTGIKLTISTLDDDLVNDGEVYLEIGHGPDDPEPSAIYVDALELAEALRQVTT